LTHLRFAEPARGAVDRIENPGWLSAVLRRARRDFRR